MYLHEFVKWLPRDWLNLHSRWRRRCYASNSLDDPRQGRAVTGLRFNPVGTGNLACEHPGLTADVGHGDDFGEADGEGYCLRLTLRDRTVLAVPATFDQLDRPGGEIDRRLDADQELPLPPAL
jgi:hypothetical protein